MGWISGGRAAINKHPQLNVLVETTTLKLITGLGNTEITSPMCHNAAGQSGADKSSNVLYGESEELNRVLILTLARAIHINGVEQQSCVKDVMTNIMRKTPHR